MLKGEDIILLLKLASSPGRAWTVRDLEVATTIPKSSVQRALERLAETDLVGRDGRTARIAQTEEFLLHGLRYVFPARLGAVTRGVPAAWGAEPLAGEVAGPAEAAPVWPHATGQARGPGLEPLHRTALNLRVTDPELAQAVVLVDGIRAGDARVRGVAGTSFRPGCRVGKREHELLELAADQLDDLLAEVVSLAGQRWAYGLLIPWRPPTRTTKDVDVVVEITSRLQFNAFEDKLRGHRFV